MIKMHYPAKGDLPETSGEMCVQRKPVLAYTKSLGWTQAIRRQVRKGKFEWVCSSYDGNTLFSDDEITAWTELPEPELVQWASCRCRHPKSNDLFSPPTEEEMESSHERKNEVMIEARRNLAKTTMEDCTTCIYQDGACYPSTTIFDKNKKCKSYVKEKSIQKTEQEENER